MGTIGFIINPVAGMGGAVGLKGTDDIVFEAVHRGANVVAPYRARQFLQSLPQNINIMIYTCSGIMGETECKRQGFETTIIYQTPSHTTSLDTKRAAELMIPLVDIIVFVGGDGTAGDIIEAIGTSCPILGVPSGVKMYSAVFTITPEDAAAILCDLSHLSYEEREVMDVDENALRTGDFKLSLKGYALTPIHRKIQNSKDIIAESDPTELVKWFAETMDHETTYILGGGSTLWALKQIIGIQGSFLGIDVVKNVTLLCHDASEQDIKRLLTPPIRIVVSPLGGQGFIFGRGNQPISSSIIAQIGKEGISILATKEKLATIDTLKVDTGDESVNSMLRGYTEIITGYKEKKIMKIE